VPPDLEPRRPREGAAPPDPLPGRFLRASLLPIQSDAHPFEGEGKGAKMKIKHPLPFTSSIPE